MVPRCELRSGKVVLRMLKCVMETYIRNIIGQQPLRSLILQINGSYSSSIIYVYARKRFNRSATFSKEMLRHNV